MPNPDDEFTRPVKIMEGRIAGAGNRDLTGTRVVDADDMPICDTDTGFMSVEASRRIALIIVEAINKL